MHNKRESGYYWVKLEFSDSWDICYWDDFFKLWSDRLTDEYLRQINENRIKNPDEVMNE